MGVYVYVSPIYLSGGIYGSLGHSSLFSGYTSLYILSLSLPRIDSSIESHSNVSPKLLSRMFNLPPHHSSNPVNFSTKVYSIYCAYLRDQYYTELNTEEKY